jgi:hypothetical protein
VAKAKAKVSRETFDEAMEAVAKSASNEQIIAHFLDMCGGARAFAKMMHTQYMDPMCTPMVKSRVLEMLLRSLKFAEGKRRTDDDLGLLSDEDLDREINAAIAKAAGDATST